MNSEYVRMTDVERLNNLRNDAMSRTEERRKAEQIRQEEANRKNQELVELKAQLAVQKEIAERDQEIIRLRNELAQRQEVSARNMEAAQKQAEIDRLNAELEKSRNQNHQTPAIQQKREIKYPDATGSDYETLKKTIYGHAKMEDHECQKAVAFVILNRARANQEYWGGNSITAVCRKPYQFWPWNDKDDVHIDDWNMYNSIDAWLPQVLNGQIGDNTNGSDHLLPNWEKQDWLSNVDHRATYGSFSFYKSKWSN